MALPRMRLVDQAYEELKQLDPNTAISKNFIRKLTKSGKIRTVQVGRRTLLSFDSLLEYLETLDGEPDETPASYGEIRPVPENLPCPRHAGRKTRA